MHKHVEWDDPGVDSVEKHFANDQEHRLYVQPGTVLTGHFKGANIRVKAEAYVEDTTIGEIAAIVLADGKRVDSFEGLSKGDMVRLPNDKRAFQTPAPADKDD